jgi:uncharacterized protein YndB with AHSA1/START domain
MIWPRLVETIKNERKVIEFPRASNDARGYSAAKSHFFPLNEWKALKMKSQQNPKMKLKILGAIGLLLFIFLIVANLMRTSVNIQHPFSASPERVWAVWTEAAAIQKWWGPENYTAPVIQSDFKVDGKFLFSMRSPSGETHWNTGKYLEIIPLQKIVSTLSFSDENGTALPGKNAPVPGSWPDEVKLTVTFTEEAGKTTVTVREAGIPLIMSVFAKKGWEQQFTKIETLLSPQR